MTDQAARTTPEPETGGTGPGHRSVTLNRTSHGEFDVTNARGGRIHIGNGQTDDFTPVELLLTAIAACTAMDVDYIVGKRAEAESGRLSSSARKVRDGQGNHLVNVKVVLDLRYPEGAEGDAARTALPMAVQRSNDRLCTVARTVQIGTPVVVTLAGRSELSDE
jgi:putative redox protein